LQGLGLWHRELYYLEQVIEQPLPSVSFSQMRCNDLPHGFVRVSPSGGRFQNNSCQLGASWYSSEYLRQEAIAFRSEMIECAWTRDVLTEEDAEKKWKEACLQGCSPWSLSEFLSPRARRLLKLSRAQAWRWFNLRRNESVFGRVRFVRGKGCWVRVGERAVSPDVCVETAEGRAELVADFARGDRFGPSSRVEFAPPLIY
jgi:hypothetical protein